MAERRGSVAALVKNRRVVGSIAVPIAIPGLAWASAEGMPTAAPSQPASVNHVDVG